MASRSRRFDPASSITPSNQGLRWEISSGETPIPGREIRARCASSRTGSGSTPGPAAKLKTRSLMGYQGYRDGRPGPGAVRNRAQGPDHWRPIVVAYKRILFGTDGSPAARAAGGVAAALATAGSAQLVIGFA